jgi:hypothetical protein
VPLTVNNTGSVWANAAVVKSKIAAAIKFLYMVEKVLRWVFFVKLAGKIRKGHTKRGLVRAFFKMLTGR